MASYNTIPAAEEPLLQKPTKKSGRKFIIAGVAAASFVLGALALTAVSAKVQTKQPELASQIYAKLGSGHCVDKSGMRTPHCWGHGKSKSQCEALCSNNKGCKGYEYGQNWHGIMCILAYPNGHPSKCPGGLSVDGPGYNGNDIVKTSYDHERYDTGGYCYIKGNEDAKNLPECKKSLWYTWDYLKKIVAHQANWNPFTGNNDLVCYPECKNGEWECV